MSRPLLAAKEHARRRAAYEASSGDEEAARLLGVTKNWFAHWRRSVKLPSKRRSAPVVRKPKTPTARQPRHRWDDNVSAEVKAEIVRLAEIEDPVSEWGPNFVMRRFRHSEIAEKFGVSESVVDTVIKEAGA